MAIIHLEHLAAFDQRDRTAQTLVQNLGEILPGQQLGLVEGVTKRHWL
jgi:hypothetical protein